jgi:hypothetical protein
MLPDEHVAGPHKHVDPGSLLRCLRHHAEIAIQRTYNQVRGENAMGAWSVIFSVADPDPNLDPDPSDP